MLSEEDISNYINTGTANVLDKAADEGIITQEQAKEIAKIQVVMTTKQASPFSGWINRLIGKTIGDNKMRYNLVKVLNLPEED